MTFSHKFYTFFSLVFNAPKGGKFYSWGVNQNYGGVGTQITGQWDSQLGRCRQCGWPGRVDCLYNNFFKCRENAEKSEKILKNIRKFPRVPERGENRK